MFEVAGVHHNTMEEAKILEYAALAESFSTHPISRSLKTAYGKEIDQKRVTDVEEISGNGVTAKVDGNLCCSRKYKTDETYRRGGSRVPTGRNGHPCCNRWSLMQGIS